MDDGFSGIVSEDFGNNQIKDRQDFLKLDDDEIREAQIQDKMIDDAIENGFDDFDNESQESDCGDDSDHDQQNERFYPDRYHQVQHSSESSHQNGSGDREYSDANFQSTNGYSYPATSDVYASEHTNAYHHRDNGHYVENQNRKFNYDNASHHSYSDKSVEGQNLIDYEEFKKLEERLKLSVRDKKDADIEIQALNSRLRNLQEEKDELNNELLLSQKRASDFAEEKSCLLDEIKKLQDDLENLKESNDKAENLVEDFRNTILTLQSENEQLRKSNNMTRLRDKHDKLVKDLRIQHQKEILELNENINKLNSDLKVQSQVAARHWDKYQEADLKHQQALDEKNTQCTKFTLQLSEREKQIGDLLENENHGNIIKLAKEVKTLTTSKAELLRENNELKIAIKNLEMELDNAKTMNEILHRSDSRKLSEDLQGSSNAPQLRNKTMERELCNLKEYNNSLKKETEQLSEALKISDLEQVKALKKIEELQKNLMEVTKRHSEEKSKCLEESEDLQGSSNAQQLRNKTMERELCHLKEYNNSLKKETEQLSEALKISDLEQVKALKRIEELQKNLIEVTKRHAEEKSKSIEECQKKCGEHFENILKTESNKLEEHKNKLEDCRNKLSEAKNRIKELEEKLYYSKDEYVKLFEENNIPVIKDEKMSILSVRNDIESQLRKQYEKKLINAKNQLEEEVQANLEGRIKQEADRLHFEWTEHKAKEIEDYINSLRTGLYTKYQNKFSKDLQREKEELYRLHEEKIKTLKKEHLTEQQEFAESVKEELSRLKNMQSQYEEQRLSDHELKLSEKLLEEKNELQKQHLADVRSLSTRYENRVGFLQTEVEQLKADILKLEAENFKMSERIISLTEERTNYREKIKKHQRFYTEKKKVFEEELAKSQLQIVELCNTLKKNEQVIKRSIASQTSEEFVPSQKLIKMKDFFLKSLKDIAEFVKTYLETSTNQIIKQVTDVFIRYYQRTPSNNPELTKDIHLPPNLIVSYQKSTNAAFPPSRTETSTKTTADKNPRIGFQTSTPAVGIENPRNCSKSLNFVYGHHSGLFNSNFTSATMANDKSVDFHPLCQPSNSVLPTIN